MLLILLYCILLYCMYGRSVLYSCCLLASPISHGSLQQPSLCLMYHSLGPSLSCWRAGNETRCTRPLGGARAKINKMQELVLLLTVTVLLRHTAGQVSCTPPPGKATCVCEIDGQGTIDLTTLSGNPRYCFKGAHR